MNLKSDPPIKKRLSRRLVEGLGTWIVQSVRIWRILDNPRSRRALARIEKKKFLRFVNPARRMLRAVLRPLTERVRQLRERVEHFHRSTRRSRRRRIYLGVFAAFSVAAFALVWLVVTRGTSGDAPETALARLMESTAKHIANNQLRKAEPLLAELQKLAPEHPTVLAFSGTIKSLRKDYAGARGDYTQALKAAPESFAANFNLGELDFITANYRAASARFESLLKSHPNDEILLYRIFLCQLILNDGKRADICLESLSPSGSTPAWYYAKAARLFRNNNKPEARKLVFTAKTVYPGKTEFFDSSNELLGFR